MSENPAQGKGVKRTFFMFMIIVALISIFSTMEVRFRYLDDDEIDCRLTAINENKVPDCAPKPFEMRPPPHYVRPMSNITWATRRSAFSPTLAPIGPPPEMQQTQSPTWKGRLIVGPPSELQQTQPPTWKGRPQGMQPTYMPNNIRRPQGMQPTYMPNNIRRPQGMRPTYAPLPAAPANVTEVPKRALSKQEQMLLNKAKAKSAATSAATTTSSILNMFSSNEPPVNATPTVMPAASSILNMFSSKTEAPKTEAPKTEAPKTEAPKTETPKTEAPKTEAPTPEPPKTTPKPTPSKPTPNPTPEPTPSKPTPSKPKTLTRHEQMLLNRSNRPVPTPRFNSTSAKLENDVRRMQSHHIDGLKRMRISILGSEYTASGWHAILLNSEYGSLYKKIYKACENVIFAGSSSVEGVSNFAKACGSTINGLAGLIPSPKGEYNGIRIDPSATFRIASNVITMWLVLMIFYPLYVAGLRITDVANAIANVNRSPDAPKIFVWHELYKALLGSLHTTGSGLGLVFDYVESVVINPGGFTIENNTDEEETDIPPHGLHDYTMDVLNQDAELPDIRIEYADALVTAYHGASLKYRYYRDCLRRGLSAITSKPPIQLTYFLENMDFAQVVEYRPVLTDSRLRVYALNLNRNRTGADMDDARLMPSLYHQVLNNPEILERLPKAYTRRSKFVPIKMRHTLNKYSKPGRKLGINGRRSHTRRGIVSAPTRRAKSAPIARVKKVDTQYAIDPVGWEFSSLSSKSSKASSKSSNASSKSSKASKKPRKYSRKFSPLSESDIADPYIMTQSDSQLGYYASSSPGSAKSSASSDPPPAYSSPFSELGQSSPESGYNKSSVSSDQPPVYSSPFSELGQSSPESGYAPSDYSKSSASSKWSNASSKSSDWSAASDWSTDPLSTDPLNSHPIEWANVNEWAPLKSSVSVHSKSPPLFKLRRTRKVHEDSSQDDKPRRKSKHKLPTMASLRMPLPKNPYIAPLGRQSLSPISKLIAAEDAARGKKRSRKR